jgi:hypothetical protein
VGGVTGDREVDEVLREEIEARFAAIEMMAGERGGVTRREAININLL